MLLFTLMGAEADCCVSDCFTGTILSAAEGVKENLTGVVGGSIILPDSLLERGFLLYNGNNIASVKNEELEILEDIYLNKLLWNKVTGLFTITDLQRNDSGVYKFDSKKGRVFTSSFKLTVYGESRFLLNLS